MTDLTKQLRSWSGTPFDDDAHEAADRIEDLVKEIVILMRKEDDALDQVNRLKETVEQFRNTNRRLNRRVQLLEGWWQRKVERAKYWGSVYLRNMRVKGGVDPKAIEEAAYQRGYEDGMEEKFKMPKRWVKVRRIGEGK